MKSIRNLWFQLRGWLLTPRSPLPSQPENAGTSARAHELTGRVLSNRILDILCFQTSDPYNYYDMLMETARTARLYCQRHGLRYESFVGIKRGYFGWHDA